MDPTPAPWATKPAACTFDARKTDSYRRETGAGGTAPPGPGVVTAAPWAKKGGARPGVPVAPPVEEILTPEGYLSPTRKITSPLHLGLFKTSPACRNLQGFIGALNDAVKGKKATDPTLPRSPATETMLDILAELDQLITDTPKVEGTGRFGNAAFKTWHAALSAKAPGLMKRLLPAEMNGAEVELVPYLLDSFGNPIRIDYGSGHELHFVALLCCLTMLGVFTEPDSVSLALLVFDKYLAVVRRIQRFYQLEPAGSHGVWGLDDHQFLCYLWGSSQLCAANDQGIMPEAIPEETSADRYGDDYLFFGAIRNIKAVKTGPFFEHSRYLFDISAVPEWKKVNKGLSKMFEAEVLYKFPVIQHFMFGTLLKVELPAGKPPAYIQK